MRNVRIIYCLSVFDFDIDTTR